MTIDVLGARLKTIRRYLGLNQQELADKLGVKQAAISRLETGKGGEINLLISLLNFYSDYININLLFSNEKFEIISREDEFFINKSENDIVKERLNKVVNNFNKEIENIRNLLE